MRVRLYDSARKVMARQALELLNGADGAGPVLDVGCGPGLIANWLGERQGRAIHGLDVAPRSVAAAQAAATGSNRFAVYGGERIPYPDEVFDAVLCLEVIEHVEDGLAMLTEVVRVMRPGGLLLLSTPDSEMARLVDKPHHVRHYSKSDLHRIVTDAGFRVSSVTHRYHGIGSRIDRALLRLGAGIVTTELLEDDALAVASEQPPVIRALLAAYDRLVDPIVDRIVWAEYRARRMTPGMSLMVQACKT